MVLQGSDLIGLAQTGTGKTAAFVLPMVQRLGRRGGPRGLVISPTRELTQQTHDAVLTMGKTCGTRVAMVIGGESYGKQLQSLSTDPEIVVGTPGRLLDQIDRGTLHTQKIEIVVLDEADRLLDMGFIPQLQAILARLPAKRQTLLFSATMPPAIERLARAYLHEPVRISVGLANTAVESCVQELYMVADREKVNLLKFLLRDDTGPVLVFARTKRGADEVYRHLRSAGHSVTVLHGDLRQDVRGKALQGFREGRFQILVATDIAARGLDVEGIERVVNFDVPSNAEDYLHRIGRTARAEREGHASTFCSFEDSSTLRIIEAGVGQRIPIKIVSREALNAFARLEIAREYERDAPAATNGRDDAPANGRGRQKARASQGRPGKPAPAELDSPRRDVAAPAPADEQQGAARRSRRRRGGRARASRARER